MLLFIALLIVGSVGAMEQEQQLDAQLVNRLPNEIKMVVVRDYIDLFLERNRAVFQETDRDERFWALLQLIDFARGDKWCDNIRFIEDRIQPMQERKINIVRDCYHIDQLGSQVREVLKKQIVRRWWMNSNYWSSTLIQESWPPSPIQFLQKNFLQKTSLKCVYMMALLSDFYYVAKGYDGYECAAFYKLRMLNDIAVFLDKQSSTLVNHREIKAAILAYKRFYSSEAEQPSSRLLSWCVVQ